MLEILDYATPSESHFELAIRGMRLPFKGQDKVDSYYDRQQDYFVIGDDDLRVAKNLINGGSPHQKFLRQLPVTLEIRAPLYWWKQLDQYKIGTTTDSESTMHTMTKYPFTLEDFSFENVEGELIEEYLPNIQEEIVYGLNILRRLYLEIKTSPAPGMEDVDGEPIWKAINALLPQSYMQTRTWSGNYATLYEICRQRANHKLNEWPVLIQFILDNIPWFSELCYDKLCEEVDNFSEKYER